MPTYAYRCQSCGESFERHQRMSAQDSDRPKCPECESTNVEQVMTSFYAQTEKKS